VTAIERDTARPGRPARALPERASALVARLPPWWSVAAIGLLLVAGAVVLARLTRGTTFWADEWQWILTRRGGGVSTLLDPHNSHLSLVPVAIYKLLLAVFGLHHYLPFRAAVIAAHLICVLLVFVYVRARVGGYAALLGAALILFFGPGWQDILWPFQLAWLIAVSAGVGALLALDRGGRGGDLAACVLLGVSLASAGPGLAVAIGVLVEVLLGRGRRALWIPAIPIVLYAVWALGYQHTLLNGHALLLLPRFVFQAAAGVLSSLTGLGDPDVYHDTGAFLTWGAPLLILALVAIGWRLRRERPVPPRVLTLLSLLVGFWLLTGIGRAYVSLGSLVLTATGDESRYLYVGAVFAVLLAAELARGRPISLPAGILVGVLVLAAVVSNIGTLRDGAGLLRSQAQYTIAELSTLDLSRRFVRPSYVSEGFIFGIVTAAQWFDAERDLGSPAPGSPVARITALPDYAKEAADAQLVKLQSLGLTSVGAGAAPALGSAPSIDGLQFATAARDAACVSYRPSAAAPSPTASAIELTVPAGGVLLSAGGAPAMVTVRRFSAQFQPLGALNVGGRATFAPIADPATAPWHLQIGADGPVRACGLG